MKIALDNYMGRISDTEWSMDKEYFEYSCAQVYVENLDYPDCSEIGTIGIKCTDKGIIRTF